MDELKYYNIITIGCQMNRSDSERLSAKLEEQGFVFTAVRKQADLVVFVTCGIRQTAEDRVYGLVPKVKKENPKAKVIVTGCLANREDVRRRLEKYVDHWMEIGGISNFQFQTRLPDGQVSNQIQNSKSKKIDNCGYLKIKPKYSSKFSAFVPIGNGCDNFCSYCVVPYARDREKYRPVDEIISEVKELIKNGYKEIILIAQNVNSYSSKISNFQFQTRLPDGQVSNQIQNPTRLPDGQGSKMLNFAGLLNIINNIPGDFWIRFSTSHPKDMSDELIETIACSKKICKHIHLPAQAGDDEILAKMNRGYTREDYVNLVKKIRQRINFQFLTRLPDGQVINFQTNLKSKNQKKNIGLPVSLSTDVIVGFPGETKKQFNNTKKLFREIKYDMAYISKYSPRPGTAALKLVDDVSKFEKKKRDEELNNILSKTAYDNNKLYLNKIVRVLIEGKNKNGDYFGKTETNKNVRIINGKNLVIGDFANILITRIQDFNLAGKLPK